jgi:hypothetical protein
MMKHELDTIKEHPEATQDEKDQIDKNVNTVNDNIVRYGKFGVF